MEKPATSTAAVQQWILEQSKVIWQNVVEKGLWRRMLKVVVATTAANAIMLIPQVEAVIGGAAYLAGITTAFGHPGRRFGQFAEAMILTVLGLLLGLGWAILGIYLGSLVIYTNPPAAYTIRGVFLAVAFLVHGFYRSHTPRLFLGTVLWIIVNVVTLLSPTRVVTSTIATQILYPILVAVGLLILVNVSIFPEFSSQFLGETAIETVDEVFNAANEATDYFLGDIPGQAIKEDALKIEDVTALKSQIRTKLAISKSVQSECNFELAFSVLEPQQLKPITDKFMTKLSMNVIAMIGACESKFALVGNNSCNLADAVVESINGDERSEVSSDKSSSNEEDNFGQNTKQLSQLTEANDLDLVKPRREIEFGDYRLVLDLASRIATPCQQLREVLDKSLTSIKGNVAYAYRVPKDMPEAVRLEDIDDDVENLRRAIDRFDRDIQTSLASTRDWKNADKMMDDIIPREEVFLISSFYLNMRQAALHICQMLEHSRSLVDQCQRKKSRRRFYAPRIKWQKWLYSGGEDDQPTPEMGHLQTAIHERLFGQSTAEEDDAPLLADKDMSDSRQTQRDPEFGATHPQKPITSNPDAGSVLKRSKPTRGMRGEAGALTRFRERFADIVEWVQNSNDVQYAFKLCIASFLLVWPAFVAQWNTWYSLNRGLWAVLQLVLITEPTFGSAINTLILRAVGTTGGCLWGWAAYGAGSGNRYVCAVMIAIGTIPAAYVLICTKYVKAGIVILVSITVVALATELGTVPGSSTENFLERYIAFMIGAVVSLFVAVAFFPVKASTRMVEALVRCLNFVAEMENCVAFGIEHPSAKHILTESTIKRFDKATSKAKAAVQTAEGLMPFAQKEPRLKGSFASQLAIYKEIIFVMHQIVDRMDNMIALRTAYGSGPLSRYNSQIYQYRRNLAGSVVLTLFAVQEALATKLPLPQFLPSCRLAQLRIINRVREAVQEDDRWKKETDPTFALRRQAARTDWLSWNAGSMAQAEVVEYLEELVDLTKLLVGANEFRSGLLTRPTYREYVQKIERQEASATAADATAPATPVSDSVEKVPTLPKQGGLRKRATTLRSSKDGEDAEIPYALRRIQSKRQEANLKRQETYKSSKGIS